MNFLHQRTEKKLSWELFHFKEKAVKHRSRFPIIFLLSITTVCVYIFSSRIIWWWEDFSDYWWKLVELPFGIHHNYDFAKPCSSVRCLFFEEMKDASETCTKDWKLWQIGKEGNHLTFLGLVLWQKALLRTVKIAFKAKLFDICVKYIFDELLTFQNSWS